MYEIPIINIFEGINGNDITKASLFTNDYIHPNNDGHKRIYDKIVYNLRKDESDARYFSSDYVINVTTTDGNTYTTDAVFKDALYAHKQGRRVVFKSDQFYNSYVEAICFHEKVISCSVVTQLESGKEYCITIVNFIENGSIEFKQSSAFDPTKQFEMPFFDLAEMGLNPIPITGETVSFIHEINELRTALSKGFVKVRVKFKISNVVMTGEAIISPLYLVETNEYQGVITTVMNGVPVIAQLLFTVASIEAKAIVLNT